jgi:hypothetical protein
MFCFRGAPSMTKSPSTIALPSFTGTSATRILLLFVMLMRTVRCLSNQIA